MEVEVPYDFIYYLKGEYPYAYRLFIFMLNVDHEENIIFSMFDKYFKFLKIEYIGKDSVSKMDYCDLLAMFYVIEHEEQFKSYLLEMSGEI